MVSVLGVIAGAVALEHGILFIIYLIHKSFNIPVAILRYEGGKERPKLVITKAKKRYRQGVPLLFVKGYKEPMRDFLNKFYYPTPMGKFGGLIMWEFEDRLLTPAIPYKKGRTKEELTMLLQAARVLQEAQAIPFDYDKKFHDQLMLKAVDDVDVDFMLQEIARIDSQYTSGWRDFLSKYAGHIVVVMCALLLMVGFVVWLQKSPEMMATCATRAFEAAKETMIQELASGITPPG